MEKKSVGTSKKKRTKKHKRQKIQRCDKNDKTLHSGEEDDNDDDYNDSDNSTSKSGVGSLVDDSTLNSGVGRDDESVNGTEDVIRVPLYGIDSNFGDTPYWNNGTVATDAELYMLSVITTYNNIEGLHGLRSTPKYSFNWGMKEFEQAGYDATIFVLSNILIVMNAVDMLDTTRIRSDVYVNELS